MPAAASADSLLALEASGRASGGRRLAFPGYVRLRGGAEGCGPRWAHGLGAAIAVAALVLLVAGPFGRGSVGAADDEGTMDIPEAGCAVNVLLVRHCDKVPPWKKDATPMEVCTTRGLLRGDHVARIFGPAGKYPVPTRLFARRMPRSVYSSRDMYLLWPLAQRLKRWVNTSFAQEDVLHLANALLDEREAMCAAAPHGSDPTALISWNHCSIPALAQALGCRSKRCETCWDDNDFETVLWLRFVAVAGGGWHLKLRVDREGFTPYRGPGGYRECIGNAAESSRFGHPCIKPKDAGARLPA